jgi:HYR domain/WD40-like Beta Propeller Repeat
MFLIMDNDVIPSPISAVLAAGISYDLLLVGGVMIIIVLSSIFNLSSSLPDQHSAFATFPGENGKIAFSSSNSSEPRNYEIYVMNADGSNPTRLTNNAAGAVGDFSPTWSPDGTKIAFSSDEGHANSEIYVMNAADGNGVKRLTVSGSNDIDPDWGPTGALPPPPPAETTAPVITVPSDITEEATGLDGAQVSFEVSAQDAEDGPVDISCDHNSGETFPIGETVVTCSAEDLAGNTAEESFTITVQDTTDPVVEITKAVDKKGAEIAGKSITKSHYIQITFQVTDAVGVDKTECSLDGQQAFTPCTSPVVYDGLKKGTHNFTIRSTDEAGNTGQDQFTWTVNPPAAVGAPGRQ